MTAEEKLMQKSLVASGINSNEWSGILARLRDRAFFSQRLRVRVYLQLPGSELQWLPPGSEFRRVVREQLGKKGPLY